MTRAPLRLPFAALLVLLGIVPARAQGLPPADPGQQCRAAIAAAERSFGIPAGLMAAIGRVESGRRMPDGRVAPWPWSINAEGTGEVFASRAEAVAAARRLQQAGVRSIDTGCMQVNLLHHPDAFPTLEAAFDPVANASYAARFLLKLHGQTGSWPEAAALYHSATPSLAADYARKVMAAWPQELAGVAEPAPSPVTGPPVPAMGGLTPGGMPAGRLRLRSGGPALLPLGPGQTGRSLADYRRAPVPLAGAIPASLRVRG